MSHLDHDTGATPWLLILVAALVMAIAGMAFVATRSNLYMTRLAENLPPARHMNNPLPSPPPLPRPIPVGESGSG